MEDTEEIRLRNMAKSGTELSSAAALVAEALGVSAGDVPEDTRIGAFESWDSLGHLRIMLAVEGKLGRQLTAAEAISIDSVPDIAEILAG